MDVNHQHQEPPRVPDGPAPAPRRRPRDRRDRILAAADVRFRRDGYHDTSMSDVASDVGIGASALYRHVRTKQELLHVVMLRSFDLVLEAVSTPDDLDGCLGVQKQRWLPRIVSAMRSQPPPC